jgi:hypothetical protein
MSWSVARSQHAPLPLLSFGETLGDSPRIADSRDGRSRSAVTTVHVESASQSRRASAGGPDEERSMSARNRALQLATMVDVEPAVTA